MLRSLPNSVGKSALQTVASPIESPEVWISYENLLISCLCTGDLESAQECIRRLVDRFGNNNDRVMALQGLVREAEAEDDPKSLEAVLKSYDEILAKDSTNVVRWATIQGGNWENCLLICGVQPIHKRRIALLRSTNKISEAVAGLVALLDFSPTDAEAWAELADVYLEQGLYAQAVYALEEVLVLTPNAWNMHAHLGEVQLMAASTGSGGSDAATQRYAAEALKRFCRSIELCDDYLRGFYGLKLATTFILKNASKWSKQNKTSSTEDFILPDTETVQRLAQLATEKLSEIVRRNTAKEPHWSGYDEAEIAAARELLSGETAAIVR